MKRINEEYLKQILQLPEHEKVALEKEIRKSPTVKGYLDHRAYENHCWDCIQELVWGNISQRFKKERTKVWNDTEEVVVQTYRAMCDRIGH